MALIDSPQLAMDQPLSPPRGNDGFVPRVRVRLLAADEEPRSSNLSVLGKGERVFHIYPEIAHRILDLAMSEQNLDRPKISRCPVDN